MGDFRQFLALKNSCPKSGNFRVKTPKAIKMSNDLTQEEQELLEFLSDAQFSFYAMQNRWGGNQLNSSILFFSANLAYNTSMLNKAHSALKEAKMATRSGIGVVQRNGTVKAIYCHFDGYPGGVGATLVSHYPEYDIAMQLIALGSISVLGAKLSTTGKHDFGYPERGVTIAYHRDRGDELVVDDFYDDRAYVREFTGVDYLYLLGTDNVWRVRDRRVWVELHEQHTYSPFATINS